MKGQLDVVCVCINPLPCHSPSDFVEDREDGKERTCDSLLMCIVTVLSHGLRSGGGVGDVLRKPSKEVSTQTRPPPSTLWREHKVSQRKTADLATVQLFKS